LWRELERCEVAIRYGLRLKKFFYGTDFQLAMVVVAIERLEITGN